MKTWDLNYISKIREKFLDKLNTATDVSEQKSINKSLQSIDLILAANTKVKRNFGSKINYMDTLEDDSLVFTRFGYYCPYIRLLQSFYELVEIRTENQKKLFPSDTELLKFSKSFYSKVGGAFADSFSAVAMHFDKTLKISSAYISNRYKSSTYCIYGTKFAFIDLVKNGTIQDYISINHEVSHAISVQMNPKILYDKEKYCFIEVDSLFFEMITLDCLDKEYPIEALKTKLDIFKDYLYSAEILGAKMDLLNEFSTFKLSNKKLIVNFLREEGYDKQAINDILYDPSADHFNYIVSYLTAIELYFIYEADKTLALSLLEKIIIARKQNCNDYLSYIKELGINPGDSLDKYIGHLMNQSREGNYIHEKTI